MGNVLGYTPYQYIRSNANMYAGSRMFVLARAQNSVAVSSFRISHLVKCFVVEIIASNQGSFCRVASVCPLQALFMARLLQLQAYLYEP